MASTWLIGRIDLSPWTQPKRESQHSVACDRIEFRSNAVSQTGFRSPIEIQMHARLAVEEEVAADHGEAAAAPDHAAKVIFDLLRRAGCDGDPDIVALPDFLPRPKRWRLPRGHRRHRPTTCQRRRSWRNRRARHAA